MTFNESFIYMRRKYLTQCFQSDESRHNYESRSKTANSFLIDKFNLPYEAAMQVTGTKLSF